MRYCHCLSQKRREIESKRETESASEGKDKMKKSEKKTVGNTMRKRQREGNGEREHKGGMMERMKPLHFDSLASLEPSSESSWGDNAGATHNAPGHACGTSKQLDRSSEPNAMQRDICLGTSTNKNKLIWFLIMLCLLQSKSSQANIIPTVSGGTPRRVTYFFEWNPSSVGVMENCDAEV